MPPRLQYIGFMPNRGEEFKSFAMLMVGSIVEVDYRRHGVSRETFVQILSADDECLIVSTNLRPEAINKYKEYESGYGIEIPWHEIRVITYVGSGGILDYQEAKYLHEHE